MEIKFLSNLYTLIEIAINYNFNFSELKKLTDYMNNKDIDKIKSEFKVLSKFIPYCNWYILEQKNILAMSAYIYDLYKETGLLPNLNNYDFEPNKEKLEHWQYINPYIYEINPNEGFEFAKDFFDCDIYKKKIYKIS